MHPTQIRAQQSNETTTKPNQPNVPEKLFKLSENVINNQLKIVIKIA